MPERLAHLTPRTYLRLEGLSVLTLATIGYRALPGTPSWALFAALFFLPDIALLGYLRTPAVGALAYNLLHSEVLPLLLLGVAAGGSHRTGLAVALVWLAHIGFDRMVGYGLKYPDRFGRTHLGDVGRSVAADAPRISGSANDE